MATAATAEDRTRRKVIRVFTIQGVVGLVLLLLATWKRSGEALDVLAELGGAGLLLVLLFVVFSIVLGLLKFELTNLVYASFLITAHMAMFPLLGMVMSAWIAVLTSMAVRVLAMYQIGVSKIPMDDPPVEWIKTFGLIGTYGIPVITASWTYARLGGSVPVTAPSLKTAGLIAISSLVLIVTNNLVMMRVMKAYGYAARKMLLLSAVDMSIYLLAVPYSMCLTFSYGTMGLWAVLALALTGVFANFTARNLAATRSRSQQLVQRLVSLSNIGKTISLQVPKDELLMSIYTECSRIVDASLFSIALVDDQAGELSFELDIREGVVLPKERLPLGEGLNSWVVKNQQPLLIGSVEEERQLGITAVQDSKPSESWLGVPMIVHDNVIGVIAIESYRKNEFTRDDLLLLTAIANQAAVALENAELYKDLEGLTIALEHRVLERTNELREANLRLIAADRSKNQFLANMSHELRTPLNSIIGFSSVLLEQTAQQLPPRFFKFLENIRTAGLHLLELINDILDLSKIEAGKMELRIDQFDIRDTISAVERVMRGFAAEANVTVMTAVDPAVPPVRLDEGRLKQILFNLLSNAVKFSPEGGPVRVSVNVLDREISPLGVRSIRVEVADKGVGMEAEELAKIFDEFYQARSSRRAANSGTGLGLSLTRNFVELHHGTIDVRSTPSLGTSFVMHLPVDYYDAAGDYVPVLTTAGAGRWG